MNDSYFKNQRGGSLVETLVMSFILVLTIQLMATVFGNFKKFEKHKRLQLSTISLKSQFNDVVNCDLTLSDMGGSCSDGDSLNLLDDTGIIVKAGTDPLDYDQYGRFKIRARCETCPTGPGIPICGNGVRIRIEAVYVNPAGNQKAQHPIYVYPQTAPTLLRGKPLRDWFPIYDKVPFKCGI